MSKELMLTLNLQNPPMKQFKQKEIVAYIVLALFVFGYIISRALVGEIVHDEAVSFFIYVQTGNFIPPWSYLDAANHLLNSALAWVTYSLAGDAPIVLRLPNVLAFGVYALYTFKIGRFITNPAGRWFMYLSFLLVHFIIEFFAYMRGYGLSMAFLTASIYYLICFSNQLRYRYFIEFVVFSLLAVFANLALLNSILVAQFLIWLIWLRSTFNLL
jgi:hypothetical protein